MAANYSDLDRLNDDMAFILLPVIVFVGVCIIMDILGNSLALLYYCCYAKRTSSNHFIIAMAVFDITVCCVSMPLEIVDMEFPLKFPSKAACKILRFVNYFVSISSGLTLVAVAIDRHRKVCQPFQTQITTKMTKIMTSVACLVSFSVSWPALVLYDVVPVNITSVSVIIGYDCTIVRKREFKVYVNIYNGVCSLFFLGSISTLIVLYIVIGRKILILKTFRVALMKTKCKGFVYTPKTESIGVGSHSEQTSIEPSALQQKSRYIPLQINKGMLTAESLSSTKDGKIQTHHGKYVKTERGDLEEKVFKGGALSGLEICQEGTVESLVEKKRLNLSDVSLSETSTNISNLKTKSRASLRNVYLLERQKNVRDQYMHLKKYTVLMLSITTAFVLSFLPHLCLVTWRTLVPQYEVDSLCNSELVAFYMFMRSWIIGSVVNPIIYGFFNTDFRVFVSALFLRCFCYMKLTVFDKQSEAYQA